MEFVPTDHPLENEYPKLVRDKIPAIIKERTGIDPETRVAENDDEYFGYLLKKVVEEAEELRHSAEHDNLEEELADISELIDALLKLRGKSRRDLETVQMEKRQKNGGFDSRIIMHSKIKRTE